MAPGKGLPELLEAFARLPGRFRLRLVGGNPPQAFASLRGAAEALGIVDRVDFLGTLAQRDVRAACAGAHIFVLPQQSDFFFSPLKLYEALALGLPVLATPLAVFAAYAGSGLTHSAPDRTPAGLAAGIRELASDPGRALRLREQGLREALSRTWLHRARTILSFVDALRHPGATGKNDSILTL
jgi:glycosyltransferase involved in cell wall biosynthesis